MAIYDEKIDRYTDWGGDRSTGYLPVSGKRVQEFIKDEFSEKIGKIYRAENGTCYCFANDDTYNEWRYSGGSDDLIIDSFLIEASYDILLSSVTEYSTSVLKGSTGNTLQFNFKIVDKKTGVASDSKAKISFTFTNGSVVKSFQKEYPVSNDWSNVNENIDDYITDGINTIAVRIEGLSTMASTQVVYTFNMFDLKYEPTFNYEVGQTGNTIQLDYLVECSEIKFLEFYIDGEKVKETPILNPRQESTEYIDIKNVLPGVHSLQTRAYIKTPTGSNFYSNLHFFSFAKSGESEPSFLMRIVLPNTANVVEGINLEMNVVQFESVKFDWSMYDYLTRTLDVTFKLGDNVITSVEVPTVESDIREFTFRPMLAGEGQVLKVYSNDSRGEKIFEYDIILNVEESSSGIKETTDGMVLKLSAMGKSNDAADRDVWEYTNEMGDTYSTTFSGFSWNAQQGWDNNTLVLSDTANIEVNLKPMESDWALRGGTFEIDFETFDNEDDDAVIMAIQDNEDGAGIAIKASKVIFKTKNGKTIETPFKDKDRMKVAFIGNKIGTAEHDNLLYIVVNGVLERAVLYENDDAMLCRNTIKIGNPDGLAKCRIRSMRAYNRAITIDEAFNNFVVDSDDVQKVYEENNILRDGTSEIDFDKIANKIPVMIFTGNMPEIYEKGIDKEWRYFDVEYINRADPETYNFVTFNCQIKLQGTSSLEYPRKNFKLKTKNKTATEEAWATLPYEYDPSLKRLKNKRTGKILDVEETHELLGTACWTFDNEGKVKKKGKYSFKEGAHKTDKWTLKADYMESSCSHNVGAGKSWNDIFKNVVLTISDDAGYKDQTYKTSAIVHPGVYKYDKIGPDGNTYHYTIDETKIADQKKYICRTEAQKVAYANPEVGEVRTAIDGFPMVCYYRLSHESTDLVFMGQYNFINDKGTQEIFGFEDIPDPADETETNMIFDGTQVEVWEGLRNTNPLTLFKTMDGWDAGWKDTLESRWPDPDDIAEPDKRHYDISAVKELATWLVSTRHENDTTYSGTLDIDSSFAERINDYQYGYTDETAESYRYASGKGLTDNAENRQKKFETEKWEHFDVWKLAGYYIYLMRYGAVDQFVKNTMLTTEGNGKYDPRTDIKYRKWYYINYDNDCLFGLRNNGVIAFDWTLDRQTRDDGAITDSGETSGNTYAMMGHDSTLWNNLERDEEFMRMVRDLDDSMTQVGLTYEGMVNAFDTTQTDKWCERIYNANEKYKYIDAAKGIGDMEGKPVNNLWMLQGTRKSHRHWWIANHFNLLNAKWLSGDYKATYCVIKTNAHAGDTFNMVAGADYYYAWGQRKRIYESNIQLKEGDAYTFRFPTDQTQGDPVVIYAVNKMSEIDFSNVAKDMDAGSFDFRIANTEVQNTLRKLIIGNPEVVNTKVTDENTGTWSLLTGLEYLDITNYQSFINVPLTNYKNLHTFKAKGTSLSSFVPAEGSRFDLIELPNTIATLDLTDVAFSWGDLKYDVNQKLDKLYLSSSKSIGEDYFQRLIKPWLVLLNDITDKTKLLDKEIKLRNINWSLTSLDDLWLFECLKKYSAKHKDSLNITGEINLFNLKEDFNIADIGRIQALLGERCFEEGNAIHVTAPLSIFMDCDKDGSMVAGDTAHFTSRVYPTDQAGQTISYTLIKREIDEEGEEIIVPITDPLPYETTLDKRTGTLTTTEKLEHISGLTIEVECKLEVSGKNTKYDYKTLIIKEPTYPDHAVLIGESSIRKDEGQRERIYILEAKTSDGHDAIGSYDIVWSITGAGIEYLAEYGAIGKDKYRILMKSDDEPEVSSPIQITAAVKPFIGEEFAESKNILVLNTNVIMTRDTNPLVFEVCKRKGWVAPDADAVLKSNVASVSDEDFGTTFKGLVSNIFSFNELQYFTSLTKLSAEAFAGSSITDVTIPANIAMFEDSVFKDCHALTGVTFSNDSTITTIPYGMFKNCTTLESMILPQTITFVENTAFGNTAIRFVWADTYNAKDESGNYKKGLVLPAGLKTMETLSFENEDTWSENKTNNKLELFTLTRDMTNFPEISLRGYSLKSIEVDDFNTNYISEDGVLYNLSKETLYRYPSNKEGSTYIVSSIACTDFANYAFYRNRHLVEMTIPRTISYYGGHLFEKCEELISATIPEDSRSSEISDYMFNECKKLEDLNLLGAALATIGKYAFAKCESLPTFNTPDGISEIGEHAFSDCTALSEITFTDNVKVVGNYVINNCPMLTDLVLPRFIKMDDSKIANCQGLTGITLALFTYNKETETGGTEEVIVNDSFNTDTLRNHAFLLRCNNVSVLREAEGETGRLYRVIDNCLYRPQGENFIFSYAPWGLRSVTFVEGTIEIGGLSFIYNPNITTIQNTKDIVVVGDQSMTSTSSLREMEFDKVERIGNITFNGSGIEKLTFYSTEVMPVTYSNSFNNSSLTDVYVPYDMIDVIKSTNYWNSTQTWAKNITYHPILLKGDYYIKVYENDEEITGGTITLIPQITGGEIYGNYVPGMGYHFIFSDVANVVKFNEPCVVDCGASGRGNIIFNEPRKTNYEVSVRKLLMAKSGTENNNITLTSKEYQSLISKINDMEARLNNL